ncbi:MAG TPA: outer membrane beta-barrel protein [Vitreimonas sp.]|uniref:outer membrane beta-barrel protein n=1 Tax=Vitreimonas sp. TaxID=3069702 RepID=UPI002D6649CB|nr:outer membrane beta-barrel protein [Vitreimonas sp.]HYD87274.1 outer membrane beta-barrel protein [Vitreimonas sp.]
MLGRMMVSALALTGVAYAQTETPTNEAAATPISSGDRVTYEAAYFNQYNPSNALDMVRQTPGFTLDGGDDRRGFSGAVGNLLIDGIRPSTKSQSVDGILSRIPANQVVRIEVLRGAAVAGDASGQSVLLNIVRTPTAGSGLWEAGFEITSRDTPAPRGELSYSGRNGNFEWGLSGSIFSQYRDLPGWRVFFDGAGNPDGRAETPSPRDFRESTVNGNVAFPLAGGRFSATGQVNWWRFHADNGFFFFNQDGSSNFDLESVFEEQRRGYELGLNYDRDFGPWSLALIALANRGVYTSEEDGAYTNFVIDEYFQDVRQESGETIFRASLARPLGERHRVEFGGEGAINTLDQALIYAEDNVVFPFTNDNVSIEEERAEFFVSETWRPTDRWSLETRVNWETSTLTFSGDTNDVVELSYWKPSVQLSRTFGANNQLRLRIHRDVGQLDFGDFTSAASVADNLIAGGNPELVPQTAWIAELGGDLRFPGGAALTFTLAQHEISDVSDLVKIEDNNGTPLDPSDDLVYDAPGNIGDGEMTRLDVNFSTPVPFIEGGRLTIEGMLADHEVTDPVTGEPRIISFTPESRYQVTFRQDLPDIKFAWGIEVFKEGEFRAHRFNETDTNEEGPWIDLFVETTALPNDMKLRLWAANLFDGDVNRDRRFFAPDRSGVLVAQDIRMRQFASAPWFILELSGRF